MQKHTRKTIQKYKLQKDGSPLQMLTCYDYQTAQLLDETHLDLILVGDSVGNVILGYPTTIPVTLDQMILFGGAVVRGAPRKFTIIDMPFGTYASHSKGLDHAIELFQKTEAEAIKIEGSAPTTLKLIKNLTEIGIPIMGHVGLTPQSIHQQGGYYIHGKDQDSFKKLLEDAQNLASSGVFSIVLECIAEPLAKFITNSLNIPTIGIGSGIETDGQVLVINDLFKMGAETPPKFCTPISDLYQYRFDMLQKYLNK